MLPPGVAVGAIPELTVATASPWNRHGSFARGFGATSASAGAVGAGAGAGAGAAAGAGAGAGAGRGGGGAGDVDSFASGSIITAITSASGSFIAEHAASGRS